MYLLIMLDTLLLRPSLHFTQLHLTPLHYACRHFTSSHLNFTQLHFTTPLSWLNSTYNEAVVFALCSGTEFSNSVWI